MKLFEVCERRSDLQTRWVFADSIEGYEDGEYIQTTREMVEEFEDVVTVYIKEVEE